MHGATIKIISAQKAKLNNNFKNTKLRFLKILDYYNKTVHSLACNKLSASKIHGATI